MTWQQDAIIYVHVYSAMMYKQSRNGGLVALCSLANNVQAFIANACLRESVKLFVYGDYRNNCVIFL